MKKLSLLFALICVSVMGWAVEYCNTVLTSTTNDATVVLSCTNPSENTYVVTITSSNENFSGLIGEGNYCHVNNDGTNLQILQNSDFVDWDSSTRTLTITLHSENSYKPFFYNPFYLNIGGQQIFNTIQNQTFDWPESCGGGGGQTPEPYDPTSVDWTSSVNTTTYHKFSAQFQIAAENAANMPTGPLNIQQPAWAAFEGLYVEFPAGVSACAFDDVTVTDGTEYDGNTGAGIVLNPSAFTNEITKVTVTHGSGTTTFYVHNANAGSGSGGQGEDPEPAGINWNEVSWLSGSNNNFKVIVSPAGPTISQEQEWAGKRCIYVTYSDANFGACSLDASLYDTQGAGKFYYTSAFLGEETEFTQVHNGTTYTFTVYNANPVTVPSTKANTPSVAISRVKGVYSMYDFNTGYTFANWCGNVKQSSALVQGRTIPFFQMGNSCFGMEYGHFDVSNMTKIHLDIWTENTFSINFYLISQGHETYSTINLTGGEWNSVDIPLTTYTAASVDLNDVFQFKFDNPSVANQTIFVDNIYFYAESDVDPEPTDIEDTNFALRSKGVTAYGSSVTGANYPIRAIDGDNGTIWESVYDTDPQILAIDLGQRRNFNLVKILWGNQWSSEFYIETSNNATDWTEAKHVTGNTDDNSHKEQTFELDSKKTARYIRFRGVQRGNGWGYTIKTFSVMLAGVPELTSVGLTSDKDIVKVGEYATLTASPKDQNNSAIAADLSYTVSPSDLGHVTDGKYYPDKYGLATITVTASAGGEEVIDDVQVWGVVSDNLAFEKTITDWIGCSTEPASNAVDGKMGTLWSCGLTGSGDNPCANTEAARDYDAYFTVDLGANYNINLIRVYFEAACSQNYKLYFSANNSDWSVGKNYEHGSAEQVARIDTWGVSDLNASDNVRYIKFHSTKAATQYRVKIYEMQVYGAEASTAKTVSATVSPASTGSVLITTGNPAVAVTEPVESGTVVTFTATPAEGYDFVNWTLGGVEVSTNPEYAMEITANTALVANFELHRDVYCRTIVKTNDNKTLYLSCSKVADNTYQIRVDGSAEARINGRNNFNFVINHTNDYSNEPYSNETGHGWLVSNEGDGYIVNTFTANDYKTLSFGSHYFAIGAQGGGEFILDNNFPAANTIAWNSTCADGTAPVMAAPTAAVLNTTDVRLTLSATDNWEGIITYNINYKPTGAEGEGTNVETTGASGATITYDIEGLTTNTGYTFTVTAKDAANNVCAAQSCTATPAGDVAAPTNVSITAVALTNTTIRLTLSADDDYVGDLTYNITYDNAGAASTSAAQGTSTTLDITGLTANTEYHFSVTATDAANNTSAAVNAPAVRTYAANLALNQPCEAGAIGLPKAESNDGDKGSRWASGGSAVHGNDVSTSQDWWYVDLGAVYDIKNIRIYWEGACPSKYKFFTSNDATNWTEIANILVSPEYSADASKVMDYLNDIDANAQGRYLKVWGYEDTNNNWAYGISFWELEAYGSLATDVTAPVISSFTADGASTTSVVLKATATDNFNGDLTYTFYCNDVALADPVVKASGVEATYVVNELSMGTNYNFKVNVSDGVNNTMSDVVVGSPINDAQAPADVTVTSEATHNSITLTLSATDNLGGMIYYTATCGETVKNAQAVSGESVEVTFDGLDYSTPYAFSIVAKDGSNNEAEPVAHNKTTLRLPYPTSAAPVPAFAEASVRPVFSSAYNKDCNFADWGSSSIEKQTYGAKKLNHEASYFGVVDFGTIKVDADDELYLSVWTNEDIQFRVVPIIRNAEETANLPERGAMTGTLVGGQWNEVHFTMSDFVLNELTPSTGYENYDKIYQIKIDRAGDQTFWLDNIYFRRKGVLIDEGSNADFIAANNNEGQDVVLNRSILANDGWYTLCVPFDMNADKVVEVFGNSTIAEMTGAEDRGSLIHLNFDYVNAIEAGHPYLIQPGISFTEGSIISGVTIKNVTPIVAGNDLMHFQGVYNATTLTDENIRFVADDNYLYSPAVGGTEMGAFRCYFTIPDGSSALAPGKRAKVVMGPQTATDIDSVQSSAISIQKVLRDGQLLIIREGRVYSAQGQILK